MRNAPPPFSYATPGNRQMLPRPTAEPIAARMKPRWPDHCSRGRGERSAGAVSSKFHRTMAEVVVAGCEEIREAGGIGTVALSGGTFQNLLLVKQVLELLIGKGFAVYRHRRVPTNDGGLALGQAVLANSSVQRG